MVARIPTSVAALVRDGLMLLVHRHPSRRRYPDCWDLVGGHVESGELPHRAVSRECVEELGGRVHDPVPIPMTVTRGERARSEDVACRLVTAGYQVRVLDNLSTCSAVDLPGWMGSVVPALTRSRQDCAMLAGRAFLVCAGGLWP